jgi:putative hydrolase
MNLIADTHTHTIASGHAHSTITENVLAAAKKGLSFLGITGHASSMEGAPVPLFLKI